MAFLSLLLLVSLLSNLSESVRIIDLHDSSPQTLEALSHTGYTVAVYLGNEHLNEVSNSVMGAEKWLKTHILTRYPSTKIATIVVGHNVLCEQTPGLAASVLPSLRNLHHSLYRWGLEREIEVSPSFSSNCLSLSLSSTQTLIKPLLNFLEKTNYSYSINPSSTEDDLFLVSGHSEWLKRLGFFDLGKINLLRIGLKELKPIKLRRLSSMGIDPFPPRPSPLSPTHSPVSPSVPAFRPHIPLHPPELAPLMGPSVPPYYESPTLPPCNPYPSPSPGYMPVAPAPARVMIQRLWCVAKPSVPAETLQEAMDYACGEGGADCNAIGPRGSCYYPDTLVAHASYAFNSYWQKNKRNGGTCIFGGTAMLINADPSFRHCRFILA